MTRAEVILLSFSTAAFLAELGVASWLRLPLYRFKDTVAAVSLSAITGLVSTFGKLFLLALYVPLYENYGWMTWTGSALNWGIGLLVYDICGYWFHRWSHRTNLGWAIHHPHHSSEELNLAVAMRTAPFRSLVDWPTLLPLALVGVPPTAMMVLYVIHVAGQFWIHVKWVPDLGPIGWIVNTPTHHRVHHGYQAGYQDANYGANLIIWDRLFGTFVPETEPALYGVTRPARGWGPIRATLDPFWHVWEDARDWSGTDRLRVWLMPPGWRPDLPDAPRTTTLPARREDFESPEASLVMWHLVVGSIFLLAVPGMKTLGWPAALVLVGHGLWAMWRLGTALDDGAPTPRTEALRAVLLFAGALFLPLPLGAAMATVGVITAVQAGARSAPASLRQPT